MSHSPNVPWQLYSVHCNALMPCDATQGPKLWLILHISQNPPKLQLKITIFSFHFHLSSTGKQILLTGSACHISHDQQLSQFSWIQKTRIGWWNSWGSFQNKYLGKHKNAVSHLSAKKLYKWSGWVELFWHCSCMRCAMVGLRWGTEERAADQGGRGFYLSALPTPSPQPTYLHT